MTRWLYRIAIALAVAGCGLLEHAPAAAQQEHEEFVPSEELPADASISFPVDI